MISSQQNNGIEVSDMMGCYDSVTVWNKYNNIFYRHIIPVKCRWVNNIRRSVSGDTASVANKFVVIIPFTHSYKTVSEWRALDEGVKRAYFTIQNSDIAALGEINTEITNEKPYTANEVRAIYAPNSFTIGAFSDNTRSPLGKHIRMEGN